VERIEVEAVVCGALQRVTLVGVAPHQVKAYLTALDPVAKVRDDFPSRGFGGGGGGRDCKTGRLLVVNVRATDSGLFWKLTVSGPDGDVPVEVSKKKADTFLDALRSVNKIDDALLEKLSTAISGKKEAVAVLTVEVGVKYWTGDDGKHFVDSVVGESGGPAEAGK
jgi:hypothetical protein